MLIISGRLYASPLPNTVLVRTVTLDSRVLGVNDIVVNTIVSEVLVVRFTLSLTRYAIS